MIGAALSEGVPVIVGLNALNRPAFEAYAGELAEAVSPEVGALLDWFEGAAA